MPLNVIILAAGQGKRMCSKLPKVLHPIAGKPWLLHLVNTAQQLNPSKTFIIYGHGGEQVRSTLASLTVSWVEQKEQLGTGHAVLQAAPQFDPNARILVLVGDIPLISLQALQTFLQQVPANAVGIVTAKMADPTGLGRILRDENDNVIGIVEDKDATAEQKQIQEISTGIIIAPADRLKHWLPAIKNNNKQAEYYLPDILPMAISEGIKIHTVSTTMSEEGQGINDRVQLAQLERFQQKQQAKQLMLQGVTLLDPDRFDLRGNAQIAADVTIDINVILEGDIKIGANSYIGPNCYLRNVQIGENVTIKANSVLEEAVIANHCIIGPFARIRPGTELAEHVHIGNFVEVKNAKVNSHSKINHLSYVGDATIDKAVNIGAGTITCNYDGVNKHRTIIEDKAFIGSNSALVAPITIGEEATIAAGSTITKNAPAKALTITRSEQRSIADWPRSKKMSE
jgi:bifunctional UDP-N-acetylglucosamine pyrophosphorylase/glucosamine-1-phosphate N-acetyltransferase